MRKPIANVLAAEDFSTKETIYIATAKINGVDYEVSAWSEEDAKKYLEEEIVYALWNEVEFK